MKTGVLVLAHGSPDDLADMKAYLTLVRRGRPPAPEMVAEFQHRYGAIPGGKSPLLARTHEQATALQSALGAGYVVAVGMRFWKPFLADAVQSLVGAGVERLICLPMAPQFAQLSVGAYERETKDALVAHGAAIPVALATGWHTHPDLIAAFADQHPGGEPPTVFTAHSLPARVLAEGDPYPKQFEETAAAVAGLLSLESYSTAYQSAGATEDEWLGPDVWERVQELGASEVIVQPLGFVCDHVEIWWDLDIDLRAKADAAGIQVRRAHSLNAHPRFIAALTDVVKNTS